MLREWLTRWFDRREATLDMPATGVRERAVEILRDVAAPLVESGRARLERTAPPAEDEHDADGGLRLVPASDAAAPVELIAEPTVVTLLVGPHRSAHELCVDAGGAWERELRDCLQAIVDGRYRESSSPGRISRRVVTMTFGCPERDDDVVVKHHELFHADPGEEEPAAAERRFDGYG